MIGIEDVFEARTACAGSVWSACRKTSAFVSRSSTTASIISAAGTISSTGVTRAEHLVGVGAALLRELLEALAHRGEPPLGRTGIRVVERDVAAGGGDDLRDPAAHLARADDEDVLEIHAARRLSSRMSVVDVNGARLWYDEAGRRARPCCSCTAGSATPGLWEPVVPFLAERFRTIRTDLRFFGRSTGPALPWSWHDDVVGVLDELGIERAALVGLSLGGRIALDVALAHPDRLWAVVGVAPGLGGHDGAPYSEEQATRYDAAEAEGDLEAAMAVDFEVWAPLGADDRIRQLWRATPDANPLPDGVEPLVPAGAPAKERLGELAVPDARRDGRARSGGLPRDRPARGARGAGRAPRRARLRPLRDATRARAPGAACCSSSSARRRRRSRPPAARSAEPAADRRADPGPREATGRIRDAPAADGDVEPGTPAAPAHRKGAAVVAQREDDVVERAVPRQVDAVRRAADGVERVHEGLAGRLLVERVHPAAAGARRPRHRRARHRLLVVGASGDAPGQQPVRAQVVAADDVVASGRRAPVRVLDQVHPRSVGRQRVEGEGAASTIVRRRRIRLGSIDEEPARRQSRALRSRRARACARHGTGPGPVWTLVPTIGVPHEPWSGIQESTWPPATCTFSRIVVLVPFETAT